MVSITDEVGWRKYKHDDVKNASCNDFELWGTKVIRRIERKLHSP